MREEGCALPGFAGAFFHGSLAWLGDTATRPPISDVDLIVVLDGPEPSVKPGKIAVGKLLLDVSTLHRDQVRSPELVLSQYHLAGSLQAASIIADPSGQLTALHTAVAQVYAKRRWVVHRCEHARDKALDFLASVDERAPWPDQVTSWLFGTRVLTHVLLIAGPRNPTVRRRYVATRELLAAYGYRELYETLLALLGCARVSRARAE